MPTIQDILDADLVIEDLQATDREGVIRELAALLVRAGKVRDADELVRDVLERESQGSTGIGNGIAIPHAKSAAITDMVVAFGRSRCGVDFESIDGQPAHLIFLLVAPEQRPGDHLKALARLSRILRSAVLREELRHCSARLEMHKLLLDEDGKYPCIR